MAERVNNPPLISSPGHHRPDVNALLQFDINFARDVFNELRAHAQRLNLAIVSDGTETMTKPLVLSVFTVATLPAAADWTNGLITVSNETGGHTVAFSDGTNWRRVQDRAIVS